MSGLEELRRLEGAATEGPWAVETSDEGGVDGSSVYVDDGITWGRSYVCQEMHQGYDDGQADAEFIVAARNQLPRILDALDAVQALAEAYGAAYDKSPKPFELGLRAAAEDVRAAITKAMEGAGHE